MQSLILILLMMHLSHGADVVTISEATAKLIVWFRNQTTLSVLGQQANSSISADTKYKISIYPPDAEQNEVYFGESTGKLKIICKKKNLN